MSYGDADDDDRDCPVEPEERFTVSVDDEVVFLEMRADGPSGGTVTIHDFTPEAASDLAGRLYAASVEATKNVVFLPTPDADEPHTRSDQDRTTAPELGGED